MFDQAFNAVREIVDMPDPAASSAEACRLHSVSMPVGYVCQAFKVFLQRSRIT